MFCSSHCKRVDAQLESRLDEAADVVGEELEQDLIDLRGRALGADGGTELGLDHREGGLDVGALVVAVEELGPLKVEVVEGTLPQQVAPVVAGVGDGVALEGNEAGRADGRDGVEVGAAEVRFVAGDLTDVEVLGGPCEQRGQLRSVGGVGGGDLGGGDDVADDAADGVGLHPGRAFDVLLPLVVVPVVVDAGPEPGGVDGEVLFEGRQRQRAQLKETLQDGRQRGILHGPPDGGGGGRAGEQPGLAGVAHVGHGAAGRPGTVDLCGGGEHQVGERKARAPRRLGGGLRDGGAEVVEQSEEALLLALLGGVVCAPLLGVGGGGHACGVCLDNDPAWPFLAQDGELNGNHVLAWPLTEREVRAGAVGLAAIEVDDVGAVPGEAGDLVAEAVPGDGDHGGDGQAAPLAALIAVVGVVRPQRQGGVDGEAELLFEAASSSGISCVTRSVAILIYIVYYCQYPKLECVRD